MDAGYATVSNAHFAFISSLPIVTVLVHQQRVKHSRARGNHNRRNGINFFSQCCNFASRLSLDLSLSLCKAHKSQYSAAFRWRLKLNSY